MSYFCGISLYFWYTPANRLYSQFNLKLNKPKLFENSGNKVFHV